MNASLEEVAMYDLYTAINDLIEQRLKEAVRTGEVINLPDWIDAFGLPPEKWSSLMYGL